MNRREILRGAGALAATQILGAACSVEGEHNVTHEKRGTDKDLNALHGEVANAFNAEVGDRLRSLGNARAKHFRMTIEQDRTGLYSLHMAVDIVSVPSGERPDHVFETRSTVWSGKNARNTVDEHYEDVIAPWIGRMRSAYPAVKFREETVRGGTRSLAYRGCMLSGG